MSEVIIVALITGGLSFAGTVISVFFSQKRSTTLITYRIDRLEEKVHKHNNLIERIYELEKKTDLQGEKIKILNDRFNDLVKEGKNERRPG